MLGNPFSGFSTFRNEEFKRDLEKEGISLKFEWEPDQKERARRLSDGEAQLIVTTLDQVIQHRPEGKIVGLIDRTKGADAVVINTVDFPSLRDLKYPSFEAFEALRKLANNEHSKGRKLKMVYAKNNPPEFLARYLDFKFDTEFELNYFDTKDCCNNIIETFETLQTDRDVVLAVIFEPFITKAEKAGYKVLLSTEYVPKAIVDVLVASDQLLQQQSRKVSKFLEVYYDHINKLLLDKSLMRKQILDDDKTLSLEETENLLEGIYFFTAKEAKAWFTNETLEDLIDEFGLLLELSNKIDRAPQRSKDFFTVESIEQAVATNEELCGKFEKLLQFKRICQFEPVPELDFDDISPDPTPPVPTPPSDSLSISETVYFLTSGSSTLTPDSSKTIDNLAKKIQEEYPDVFVKVIGHASRTGGKKYNDFLSYQRAKAVEEYLRSLGLKNTIDIEAQGFSNPLPDFPPKDRHQQRAEISLVRQ
ncbi:MAG: phosphate ABC transporter substrate-binding/OmpA family protein [Xenococcus sp. MO_188.B8]|nr:phosphate ABC transporter substrate-binding/OmpA family protein [Xenococcus sp. MO_188.B8]